MPTIASSGPLNPAAAPAALAPGVNNPAGPSSPARSPEAIGQMVGAKITKVLQDNQWLLEKAQNLDLDGKLEDFIDNIGPHLEGFRAKLQGVLHYVPKLVDRKVIGLFDSPDGREMSERFFTWLRSPVDPALLPPKEAAASPEALSETPAEKPPAKKGFFRKLWPFGKDKTQAEKAPPSTPASDEAELQRLIEQLNGAGAGNPESSGA